MPDKFKDTFPVPISFVSGEQPSAAKLTAWALQTNAALNQIENALGDMHSDFFPLFGSTNTPSGKWSYGKDGVALDAIQTHLQILNLARLVGPASALNPRILGHHTATITDEPLPSDVNEFYLRFRPAGTVTFSLALTKFATAVGSAALVTSYGEYYVDALTGKVVVWDGSGSNGTVTYSIKTTTDNLLDTYHEAYFNVCPAPQQAVKCTIAASGSDWRITLPVVTHQQGDWTETSTALTAQNDPNFNAQLSLPLWLSNEYVASDVIADGLLAVWDEEERRVINGAFKFVSATEVDYDGDTGEVLVAGSDRYSLLVSGGTDITRTIDNLRSRYRVHTHDGTNADVRILHADLSASAVGWVEGAGSGERYSFFDDSLGDFDNMHPQYLGRWGIDSSTTRNALLGDLLIAEQPTGNEDAPVFGTGSSFYIYFSDSTGSSPRMRYVSTSNNITIYDSGISSDEEVVADASDSGTEHFRYNTARTRSVIVGAPAFQQAEMVNFAMSFRYASMPTVSSYVPVRHAYVTQGTPAVFYADITPYIPNGATITKFELDIEFFNAVGALNSPPYPKITNAAIINTEFGGTTIGENPSGGVTWDSLPFTGSSRTQVSHTLVSGEVIEKGLDTILPGRSYMLAFTAECDAAVSATAEFHLHCARITFTHDILYRGA